MDSQSNTLECAQACKGRVTENDVKVFVLTPLDLERIGLTTKVENGQAVLLPTKKSNNVDTSVTLSQVIAKKKSVNFKDVMAAESVSLEIASSSASTSQVTRNPKRKDCDEQDVTITLVNQNEINAGLSAATAKNVEDVTVTVSKLAVPSKSLLESHASSPQIKRPCGNNARRAKRLLGNAANSPQIKTTSANNLRGPATKLSSGVNASQTKVTAGTNSAETANVLSKGVISSPVKTKSCRPNEEKEKWRPNLLKRTCKLTPIGNDGSPLKTPQQQTSGSATGSIGNNSNKTVKTQARRMLSGFARYWIKSLGDVGYIRCPLRACNYISLSYHDMTAHYATCAGVSTISDHMCPVCQKRLSSDVNVELHLYWSHRPTTATQEEAESKPSREPEEEPPPRVLIRKRGYSKVHKISWTISLEQKGYIECLFQNCGFLALNMEEMIKHYGICNGSGSSAHIPCPFCNGRVENLAKLDKHILISHAEESKQADTENEIIDVVGTTDIKPVISQNSHDQTDAKNITVGQLDTPGSCSTNISELHSHKMDQRQEATEYILPDIVHEDIGVSGSSIKSFSNVHTKNGSDSLENITTDSSGENNFLQKPVPEKHKSTLIIGLSDCQSSDCELVGTETVERNHSLMNVQQNVSKEEYNVQNSETVIVSIDPHDITEAEGISTNIVASGVDYDTISLNTSDITKLEKGIQITKHNVISTPSNEKSSAININVNKSNEEEVPITLTAVSDCCAPVIQANTHYTKNLNTSDSLFSSSVNGIDDIDGVLGVSDLCGANNEQEILTKSSAVVKCLNVSNISSENSNSVRNDTVCADNLDNSSEKQQKMGISCPRYIQSKILMLPDSCDTEIRKPLTCINKKAETVLYVNKPPASRQDLFTCSLSSSPHIKNPTNTGSSSNTQQRLMFRNEDGIAINLLSYSALSGAHTIVYSDHQWKSKLSAVSSSLGSSPYEKIVTDKSHVKTYSKKNSPSAPTDRTKNQKAPCFVDTHIFFGRPSVVNFEEDVYVNKSIAATVAAVNTL